MENLTTLLGLYKEDARIKEIAQHISSDSPYVALLSGLKGAQDCFVLSGIQANSNQRQIYIAHDKEEAAYVFDNLANLLDKTPILFFPDSFKRPMQFDILDRNNILRRTESVNKITAPTKAGAILITYPEALFEKVVSPEHLEKTRINIKAGEKLDVDFLIEILIEYGFERVDFVYEPGQFSIRGGIIDIFSFGNEWPYRVELFDDEVETIRTFDPTTQLSNRNIAFVSIVPNINSKFDADQKVSVFDVLNSSATIWIHDFQMLLDKLQQCFEKAEDFQGKLSRIEDEDLKEIFNDRAFIFPKDVIQSLEKHHILLLGKEEKLIPVQKKWVFSSRPQPHFNKNFALLIDNLKENDEAAISTYIFTHSNKQVERFYAIFEDLQASVQFHPVTTNINQGFIDDDLKLAIYTDHQIFDRFHRYRLRRGFTKDMALSLKMLRELQPGDYVTHIDHGLGRYSGLEKIDINGHIQESVRLVYKNNDLLYVSINSLHKITKYSGKDGHVPKLDKLGSDTWKKLKNRTKRKVKDIAQELIKLYAKRRASEGYAFQPDGYLQNELEASFIYEDTPDQLTTTQDVKEDMLKAHPMDRLICGDVGFGKTEIAIRAAFKAVVGGKQVAILVPTTILALQHYRTFSERLKEFPVSIDYVNRFRTMAERRAIFDRLKSGELDLVIGTHGILNKQIGFKDLGLLIIDEEQKFGVAAKEKLRNLKVNVDTLTLTATPIPRTLQFSLMAARDLSVIRTPPLNRQPIHTETRIFNNDLIKDAIDYEIHRGGQVFFVHNRVKTLPDVLAMLNRLCPDVNFAAAHGQMDSKQLEHTLLEFIDGKFDVLLCTNIIETGLDIPNANTIMINNAHQFGLSDLHQLRGRVGRSNRKAFCYLFSPPLSTLTSDARKRLKTLEEFSDLGSGFQIAMRDLDLRGAGNMLGGEQSGFISDIGFETYQKILDEAIQELKETEFKELFKKDLEQKRTFVRDVQIDADTEMLITDDYVNNIQERLNLYTELDQIKDEKELNAFGHRLTDRFGKMPKQVLELFDALRVRWQCKKLGFERLNLKGEKLRCYFIENQQSPFFETTVFKKLLEHVSINGSAHNMAFKHSTRFLILIKEDIKSLRDAHAF